MTNSVTVNGNTYNDGNTPPNNMGQGGHRANLLPMLSDAVADLAAKVTASGVSQTAAAASALSAINSPGTQGTSTTSATVGLGSQTITIQAGKALVVGMWVICADSAAPGTNYMAGPITA